MPSSDEERCSTTTTPTGEFYIQQQKEMDAKFQNVIVMMEIGKFYEVYTFETELGEIGRAKEMSKTCNIILTKKNKNQPSTMSNPHMCGFPAHSLPRYINHLISHSYTVAVYNQVLQNNKIERVLQGVYSPSVVIGEMEDALDEVDRGVMAICLDKYQNLEKKDTFSVVVIYINTSNGRVVCVEDAFIELNEATAFIYKLHDLYRPQEMLYRSSIDIEIPQTLVHIIPEWKYEDRKFNETEFQEIVLKKVYPQTADNYHISIIEEVGLERHPDVVAMFVYCLTFLEEHHPLAIYRLQLPSFSTQSDHMFYNTQSLYDLNIFSSNEKNDSLLDILDHTTTPAGRRLLRKNMFTPHLNIDTLNKSYDEIGSLIPVMKDFNIKKEIQFYSIDVEHIMRRLYVGNVNVPNIFRFIRFLLDFDKFIQKLPKEMMIFKEWIKNKDQISQFNKDALKHWDFQLMQAWRSWETDGIWKHTPQELVEKEQLLMHKEAEVCGWISKNIGKDMFQRLVIADDDGYITITKKMHQELKDRKDLKIKPMSSNYRVSHSVIDAYVNERRELVNYISKTRRHIFQSQVKVLLETHSGTMDYMIKTSAHIDMMMSHATNAIRFRLSRPEPSSRVSVLEIEKLRHLIVEVANPSSNYVANDVGLTQQHGVLLFGQNSAGKCFQKNTKMVLWSGEIKKIQDLTTDDLLIGDDGMPRKILALTFGNGALYNIVRTDTNKILMTVNEEHILCLTDKEGHQFIEVPVKCLLQCPNKYKNMRHQHTRSNNFDANGIIIKRNPQMEDDEWNKIYLSFLHSGRRIKFSPEKIVVEASKTNIIPFKIVKKTDAGDYFGFGLDSNERFMMPDGTIAHNSTLMKSIGIAVIMAQTGMYVPCASMKWSPFDSLFTKIGSRDNIWKGKSTFISEMNDLKHIIDRSSNKSLVLCDELTSGTESYSASAIVASTLGTLLEKNSKFIMTTHLHTLKQFTDLMSHQQLRVMHFSMEYNKEDNKLHFDRVLREGSGKSIYGLEIAEYLGFSTDFLKDAFQYRSRLDPSSEQIQPQKRSRYNSKKWMTGCQKCGSTTDLHTHHIQPQQLATKDGYIGTYHKNKLSNLMVLCQACHNEEHHHS